MRKLVLKKCNQIFDLSTGFYTIQCWNTLIETNCFAICHDIFYNEQYSDEKFIDFNFVLIKLTFY